uniref:Uncharacterized protein n=1 Tax=Esox lucius TaxID=8010 RepID=A0A3P9AFG5_ESOLU
MMRIPRPLQFNTYPLQVPQRTFLLSCSLVVFPLYRSSNETLKKQRAYLKIKSIKVQIKYLYEKDALSLIVLMRQSAQFT